MWLGIPVEHAPWLLIQLKKHQKQGFKVLTPLERHTKWRRALHNSTVPYLKETTLAKVVAVLFSVHSDSAMRTCGVFVQHAVCLCWSISWMWGVHWQLEIWELLCSPGRVLDYRNPPRYSVHRLCLHTLLQTAPGTMLAELVTPTKVTQQLRKNDISPPSRREIAIQMHVYTLQQ